MSFPFCYSLTIINNFIPLIMGCLGVFLASWLAKWSLSPDIILQGLISGLASTGCYEAFANLIENIKLNHLDSIEDEEEYEKENDEEEI